MYKWAINTLVVILTSTLVVSYLSAADLVAENLEDSGQLIGGASYIADPVFDSVLSITENDDGILYSPSTKLSAVEGDYALSFWFKPTQSHTGAWRSITFKGETAADRNFAIYMHPNSNRVHYRISTTQSWNSGGDSSAELNIGEWHHLAYVVKGNVLTLYINGRQDSSAVLQGDRVINDGSFYIGHSPYNSTPAFGEFAEMNIYQRTLTQLEIRSLYKAKFVGRNMEEQGIASVGTPLLLASDHNLENLALTLDSADDGIKLANSIITKPGTNTWSLAFWLRLDSNPVNSWTNIIHKGTDDLDRDFGIWRMPNSNRIVFALSLNNNQNANATSVAELQPGEWHHISLVRTGSELQLLIDGLIDSRVSFDGGIPIFNDGPVHVGKSPWYNAAAMTIDELSFFNYHLAERDLPLIMQRMPSNSPAQTGEWSDVIPWPQVPVSLANLPDGRILSWSGSERATWPRDEQTYSSVWDPETGEFDDLYQEGHNMFCAHLAMTEDGQVFVNGGRNQTNSPWTSLFDYEDNKWTQIENMASGGRWYPVTNALPSGEVITSMGSASNLRNPEKWSPEASWQVLNGVDYVDMRQTFNGTAGQHKWWPILSVAPNGSLFHYWNAQENHFIDTSGTGSTRDANTDVDIDQPTGVAIQYDAGKMLMTGGNQGSRTAHGNNERAYTIDLNGASPLLRQTQVMHAKRTFHNLVPLPNGEVIAVGGSAYSGAFNNISSVYRPEIWNPETGEWRLMARASVPRNYHSTALLLTDGRVLSAGGGYGSGNEFLNGASHQNGQVYSPPYLFKADGSLAQRPEISSAPGIIHAGQNFNIDASNNAVRFSMLRMGATTHAVNTDSRFVWLDSTDNGDGSHTLTPNANPNVLIPGYWMMFALDENDVPSLAHIVRVERGPEVTTPGSIRYVKFIANSEVNNNPWTSIAELNLLDGNGQRIARSSWQVSVNSFMNANHDGQKAIDGDVATMWHTDWSQPGIVNDPKHPHDIVVDLGASYALSALQYLPRQDMPNGRIKDYAVEVSSDGFVWTNVAQGSLNNGTAEATITFGSDTESTIIDPVSPSAAGNDQTFSLQSEPGLEYLWSWGDGTQSSWTSSISIDHSFASAGRYEIVVSSRNPLTGQQSQQSFTHIVYDNSIDLNQANRWLASTSIAYHPDFNQLWNVNPDNNSVTIIDSQTFSKLAEVVVGEHPTTLAFDANGKAWVVNRDSGSISIISAQTYRVEDTINLPNRNTQPYGILIPRITSVANAKPSVNAYGALVTLESTNEVIRINLASYAIDARLTTVSNPRHIAHHPSQNQFYVSSFITPPLPDESTTQPDVSAGVQAVHISDFTNFSAGSFVFMQHSDRARTENSGPGIPNYLGSMAIHPTGTQAYLPSKQDNILGGTIRTNGPLIFDQTVRAISSQLELNGNQASENLSARIEHDNASVASAAVYGPYGIHLFTALEGNQQVAVSLPENNAEIARFDVGFAPQGLALSKDGNTLAVHNFMSRSVEFIDVSEIVQAGGLDVERLADVATVTIEKLSDTVLAGKQLFYDARDDRLAALDYMSCASCHNDGGHDGRVWDFTQFGEGLRNTISLRGKAGMGHGLLHWTGNFDELQDFEGQIRSFAGGSGLMSDADFFDGSRDEPMGDTKSGLSSDLDALAAYMTSLNQVDSSPQMQDAGLSAQARAGMQVYKDKGCAACHGGLMFTDSNFGTRSQVGTITNASGQRLSETLDGLDTPSLLGLATSAPYLHDGSAATLAEAISQHNNVALNSNQVESLVTFLHELPMRSLPTATNLQNYNGNLQSSDNSSLVIDSNNKVTTIPHEKVGAIGESEFSVTFWMKLQQDHTGRWRSIMHKGNVNRERTFAMWMLPGSNRIHYRISATNSWNEGRNSVNEIPLNEWTHISYVQAGNQLRLYINGELDSVDTLGGTVVPNTGDIHIGSTPWYNPAFASYTEVNVYDRSLSAEETAYIASYTRPATARLENLQSQGVASGSPVRSSKPKTSLTINSNDDLITIPHADIGLLGENEFSVSFWMRLEQSATGQWRSIMHKGNVNRERTFALWMRPGDNKLHYRISTAASWNEGGNSIQAIPLNTWTHISYVQQGEQLTLYINGELDSVDRLFGKVLSNTGDMYIGSTPWYNPAFASYAEVNIYDNALSREQAEKLAEQHLPESRVGDMQAQGAVSGTPQRSNNNFRLGIDSNDDLITMPHSIMGDVGESAFSISFWMKLTQDRTGQWRSVMHKGNANRERTFAMWMRPWDNKIHYRISTTTGWNEGRDSLQAIPVNQWTHINYIQEGNELKLYINGELDSVDKINGVVLPNSGDVYIGSTPWYNPAFAEYEGINFYDFPLTINQAEALYTLTLPQ